MYNNEVVYNGDFLNGKKNGECEIYFIKDKNIFKGKIKENILTEGIYYYNNTKDNIINYEGLFNNNKANGEGKITFINKDIFKGEFKDSIKSHKGIYQNNKNDKCLLMYINGKEIVSETVYQY